MLRRGSDDGGSTHVLEAIIVAVLMVSAVAYVATYDTAPPPNSASQALLQQSTSDALAILADTPVRGSPLGDNMLSIAIMECLQGDCSRLDTRLVANLPPGTRYSVALSNGYGRQILFAAGAPNAEATSASRLIEPAWSYTMLAPGLDAVNPTTDPLVLYALPLVNSNTVHPDGSLLRVTVQATRVEDGASYVLTTSASTRAAPASRAAQTPAVSMHFVDGAGNPLATQDLRAQTLVGGLTPSNATIPLLLRVQESAGVPVPAGTRVTLHVPQGWVATAPAAANAAEWLVHENATTGAGGAVGSTVVATLTRALSSAEATLRFDARYLGADNDHYPFRASLSQGAAASATLVVVGDNHGAAPYEVPDVYVTAPRPMGATSTTTWALSVVAPSTTALGDGALRVTRIEIVEETGAPIFASVAPLAGGSGTWSSQADRLVWTGDAVVAHAAPLGLTFRVTGSGKGADAPDNTAFVPTVDFDGWRGRLISEIAPGLYRGTFHPAGGGTKGYNASTGAGLWTTHDVTSTTTWRGTPLPGSADYRVGHVAGLKDSLYGTDVGVEQRRVPLGGTAQIHVDVQSLLYGLGPLQASPTVRLHVYPPWAGDTRVPIHSATLLEGESLATLLGGADRASVGIFDHEMVVPHAWLFGAYLVEVEVEWAETVSATVSGSPLADTLTRQAHVYDYVLVTPPGGITPISPVYDVQLLTWLADWG